ncbi:hypothetical protein [Algoriphagus hitonicola]|uniref:Uncharacterized protein n=1 Tax=Algoriphagus hitonicola TaxID=435880 RepID=A0A1I2T8J4_9BACT|nr:hypothetical protein [Algoriphagus hitonicola]SFG58876.1 hypothetical protein SAMN04487988_105175 [Algoriphagus hitonicola]
MKKIFKGSLAIVLIKLIVVLSSFVYSSCQEIEFTDDISNDYFLEKFRDVSKIQTTILKNRITSEEGINSRITSESTIEGMEESELKLIIEPMVSSGVELLMSYGLTEDEIIYEFGSLTSPDISRAALAVSQLENLANDGYTIEGFDDTDFVISGLFVQQAYASDIYDCALQAAGVKVLVELASEGLEEGVKKLGKKGVKKLVKKVASRTLGWVGAAVAGYEFGDCMGWW